VYAYDVNKLGGSVRVHTKKTEYLVVASKDNGLTVNADKIAWPCLKIILQDDVTI